MSTFRLPSPPWCVRARLAGAVLVARGEHGFYAAACRGKVATDADARPGELACVDATGRETVRPTRAALSWLTR
jgi:hypothetical protein